MKSTINVFLTLLVSILLISCGGGGESEPGEGFVFEDLEEDPISVSSSYSGSKTHTTFDRRTAKPQSFIALSSLDVYIEFASTAINLSAPSFISNLPSVNGSSAADPILNDDGSFFCSSGRSKMTDSRSRSTGLGDVSFFYDNCRSGGLLFDGSFTIQIKKYSEDGGVTRFSILFEEFLSYESDEVYGLVDGKIDSWIDEYTSLVNTEGSIYMIDTELDGAVLMENISMRLGRYDSSSVYGRGRIFLENYGYSDFFFSNADTIAFEGASDSGLTLGSSSYYSVYTIDLTNRAEGEGLSVRIPIDNYFDAAMGSNIPPNVSTNIQDVSVEKEHIVSLSSEQSADANFDFLKGEWRVVSEPEGCSSQMNNITWFTADFVSGCSGNYVIEAAIDDGELRSTELINVYIYKDFGEIAAIDSSATASLGVESEVQYEILNPDQGPFKVNSLSAPFPVSFEETNESVTFMPHLPIINESTDLNLPFSIENDRYITRSIKVTVNGNNAPYKYVSGAPTGGIHDPLQVVDYDNDGKKEVIQSHRGVPLIYEITDENELIFEWAYPYAFDEEINTWSWGSKFVDYDLDGDYDLMTLSGSHLYFINGGSKEIDFEVSGLCDNEGNSRQSYNHFFSGNFDSDSDTEVVVYCNNKNTIQFVELSAMEIAWETTVKNGQYFFVGNVDNDAEFEAVIASRSDGQSIDVVDYQDRSVVSNPIDGWFNFANLADVDGDGIKEVVTIIEYDFDEWGRVYDPKTGALKLRLDINQNPSIDFVSWRNIDSDPEEELFILGSFWNECGEAEVFVDCLRVLEFDGGALVEQAHHLQAYGQLAVDFMGYSVETNTEYGELFLSIQEGTGYRARSSIKKFTETIVEDVEFNKPPASTTYRAAEGFSFFHDLNNKVLKYVSVIGNQVQVKNFNLDDSLFMSDEIKKISDLPFNPDSYGLIRTSDSSFDIFMSFDINGDGQAAVYDYDNEIILSQTDRRLYHYEFFDVNNDGHQDVIFTDNLLDTSLNYWDVHNDTIIEDFIIASDHEIVGFKVDNVTGNIFVVVDEFIDDLILKRYVRDSEGGFRLKAQGSTDANYKGLYFGDYDDNGIRDVYLPTYEYNSTNWQFKIFDYGMNLVEETESAPLTYELAFIETDTLGDIFVGSHFTGISYTDPGHALTVFSPLHNEAMWVSPELDILGYDGDIHPFMDNGRLRLAVDHSGLYITK